MFVCGGYPKLSRTLTYTDRQADREIEAFSVMFTCLKFQALQKQKQITGASPLASTCVPDVCGLRPQLQFVIVSSF